MKDYFIERLKQEADLAFELSKKHDGILSAQFGAVQYKLVELIAEFSRKQPKTYKSNYELKLGDFVECVLVHKQSTNSLTKNKKYEVIMENDHVFFIYDDKKRKKRYYKDNAQFRALS